MLYGYNRVQAYSDKKIDIFVLDFSRDKGGHLPNKVARNEVFH